MANRLQLAVISGSVRSLLILRIFLFVVLAVISFGARAQTIQIQTSDGEDVLCVNKMTQPAFKNQLLKYHKFQERPSEFPSVIGTVQSSKRQTFQALVSTANCPDGTIPIRPYNQTSVKKRTKPESTNYTPGHEYAIITTETPPKLYGAKATINIWDPVIEERAKEMSISQIWISSGHYGSGDLNTIEIGWQVLPTMYKDNKPRLFLFWTNNAYKNGCYNVQCPGFIQTSSSIVIGGVITPTSSLGGRQFEITIHVWKDRKSGNWWLSLGPNHLLVGYWPAEIFTTLADHATIVEWGGEILNSQSFGRHTMTQMGSGHFPDEGFRKSSYFRNLQIVDYNNSFQPIENLSRITTHPECYNIRDSYTEEWKTHFFYGGPGFRTHSGAGPPALVSASIYISFLALIYFII